MNKERIYSTHSRGKVYHIPGCRYANRIPEKYAARQTKYRVESEGYRPCRCCNTLKFRVEREFHDLNLYCKDKQIEFHLKPDALFVKTEIGCWKIVYRNDLQNYALYHRNDTGYWIVGDGSLCQTTGRTDWEKARIVDALLTVTMSLHLMDYVEILVHELRKRKR